MIHTSTDRHDPLMKDDTLMSNHLEGKENYSGSTNTQFTGLAGG